MKPRTIMKVVALLGLAPLAILAPWLWRTLAVGLQATR